MAHFESVTFGGVGFDRAAELRGDDTKMAAIKRDRESRSIVFWRGKPLVSGEGDKELVLLELDHSIFEHAAEEPIFLGRGEEGCLFAQDISAWEPMNQDTPDGSFLDQTEQHYPGFPADQAFSELRTIMTRLSDRDAELCAMTRSLLSWHATHRFCSKCGAESHIDESGWRRRCDTCSALHFPRTDPVVIMLVTQGNSVLVGRSPGWPDGMFSLLAGFLEPGETPEAAVRREVFEEAGIRVGAVEYLGSQPWAFPSSLMLGFHAEALGTEITLDPVELEDAIWMTREEVMLAFSGEHPRVRRPRNGAIAHFILKNWLEDCLD
ncbi:NAD(+) diphosphatase [Cognatishimia activa]|uniref:NAD(+) diphosphatase n=1 Tax=Cognatishimia activa TaxID=1715691 RepID=UPI00222F94EE|nr:NAD(+) diphosphatase [Cognatishimia activa]UZD90252.1 NAD(+) diphosphatase [Cognatishimia activa]